MDEGKIVTRNQWESMERDHQAMEALRTTVRDDDRVIWGLSVKTPTGVLRRFFNLLTWRIRYVLFGEVRL